MRRPFALPGTRPRYAPDRVVDVEHIRIEVRLDVKDRRIDGVCETRIVPIADDLTALELDAVEMDIKRVTLGPGEKGEPLPYAYDGHRLRIQLGTGAGARPGKGAGKAKGTGTAQKPGVPLTLRVEYACHPRRGLYFIAPDAAYPDRPAQVWSQGQDEDSRHWFPCFDSPNEKSTSEVVATVPSSWFALSNGVLVKQTPAKHGEKTFHWRFDVPHSCYLITLAAGEFAAIHDRWQNVEVSYYVPKGREADAKRTLGKTPDMLALFSQKFGLEYPYTKYAQVCVAEFIFGGMENTTATTLTDAILFDERAALDYDMEALVAHELAHQWFGDLLTCRDWGQGWLNEGFATYSEYIWREHAGGRDEAGLELDDWADQYFGEDSRRYRRPIATNVYEEPIDIFDHHLYEKGGLVLHMLRRVLGEGAFWKAIGHYVRKHREGSVETRDLARAIEDATGKNLDWFFEQWIHKAGHPELKVDVSWDAQAKLAKVTVKQTQKTDAETPLFRLPTEVRFRVAGKDVTCPIEIVDPVEVFTFPLGSEPTQAIFDPGRTLLARVSCDKARSLWLAELASAEIAADRIQAARALSKQAATQVVDALAKQLRADAFWGVRAACADALGSLRTEAARDALSKAIKAEKHPKARRAVVRALGEFRKDGAAAKALEAVVASGDDSYFVEAEACLALGRTRSERAPKALREALERPSHLDVIRQFVYRGLAEARDDSALDVLLGGTRYGKLSHGRRAAIMALAALLAGRTDRDAQRGREAIEELLEDPDFRVQTTAIEALLALGDARAVPALRRAVDRAVDGRIRRRGREVIRDLSDGRSAGEAVREVRDEVDKLKGDLLALRERLVKLEGQKAGRKK
jgi:aminopeptidase N